MSGSSRWRGEQGQALVESSLLLAALVGALAVGGTWLLRSQPEMMKAVADRVSGAYFTLSLPFP